jgi:hypothetical protein
MQKERPKDKQRALGRQTLRFGLLRADRVGAQQLCALQS